jgi:hydrophobe/amphiphile efflux-1 (HAE1) family protein
VKISDYSIRKPVFAWMLMAAMLVFGGIGVSRLGISKMPDVDFPQVTVEITYEGAAPEVMETDVVEVVEDVCTTVEGIKQITSTSKQGRATVTIEFELGRKIDAALQDVQTKIAQAQKRLPSEMDPPVVTKTNPEDQPIMWVAVSGPRPQKDISDIAQYQVKERLQTVEGVGEVQLGGHREHNLRIWADAARLEAFDLTVTDVLRAIQREHVELPAGRIEGTSREINVRAEGEAPDVGMFREIIVAERNGAQVRVKDVAVVEDGLEDRRRIARMNGLPAQGLGIKKQRGANAVAVARAVKVRLEEIRADLPEGLSIDIAFDGTKDVEEAVNEIIFTMILAVLLTSVVCWVFLGSISSTVNVLLAIPTSIVGTFAVMYFAGFTLNTFTLLGLSLAVGIVVDDAIMVLENIFRHVEEGESRIRAAVAGTREIAFAALAATAAIIAIFLPVAFMKGIIGAFFFQFGVTISVAVALSLLEALTLTPSRCAQFIDAGGRRSWFGRVADAGFDRLARAYRATLAPALRWRWAAVLLGIGLFGSSLLLVPGMRKEMTPPQDIDVFLARLQMPVGTSIDATDAALRRCEASLKGRPEVARYLAIVGGFAGGEVNSGGMFVTLLPARDRKLTVQKFMADMRAEWSRIPGLRVAMQDLSLQGFTASRGYPVEFSVQGPDWEKLADYSHGIMERMRAGDLYQDIDTDYLVGMPEVKVRPERERAAAAGVSVEDIAVTLNALVGGVRTGKYKQGGRRYDIRLRLLSDQRLRPEDIGKLRVRAASGELMPLRTLVTMEEMPTLNAVTRRNRERAISVFANVAPGKSQGDAVEEVQRIAGQVLPEGYRIQLSGSAQALQETARELIFALVLGIAVAYMILASQFNSFAHPLTVLTAMPFSLTGAIVALKWADLSLNIYSFIGLILLMGIVKKNSILLVDFTNQRRLLGDPRDTALLHACPQRLRPIVMTSVSTVAGALPAALAAGPGGELRQPMALAVVGGVTISTLLTLFVVPALYSILDSVTRRIGSAARIERETTQVLADLQSEEIERFRHHRDAKEPAAAPAPASPAAD